MNEVKERNGNSTKRMSREAKDQNASHRHIYSLHSPLSYPFSSMVYPPSWARYIATIRTTKEKSKSTRRRLVFFGFFFPLSLHPLRSFPFFFSLFFFYSHHHFVPVTTYTSVRTTLINNHPHLQPNLKQPWKPTRPQLHQPPPSHLSPQTTGLTRSGPHPPSAYPIPTNLNNHTHTQIQAPPPPSHPPATTIAIATSMTTMTKRNS
jgi:hypothetical protein